MNETTQYWQLIPALLYALYALWMSLLELFGVKHVQPSANHKFTVAAIGTSPFLLGFFFKSSIASEALISNLSILTIFGFLYLGVYFLKKIYTFFATTLTCNHIENNVEHQLEEDAETKNTAYWRTDGGYWSTNDGYWG